MNKEVYEVPAAEVVVFAEQDIVTSSGGVDLPPDMFG